MSSSTVELINTALITGGSGGIGKAIAESLIKQNKKVIIVGRTESKLKETAESIGAVGYYVMDTGDIASVPEKVQKILADHPDLNCLINNAGVQRPFQFPGSGGKDYDFDPEKADQEININIRGPMHLIHHLLPHFIKNNDTNVVMNVSSVLGYNPVSVINPVYNGCKAWVHFFTMNLRTQFANGENSDKLKVVEIAPPTVSTDLHRERVDPHDNSKEKSKAALSLEEFMDEVEQGWKDGKDVISAGPGNKVVSTWYDAFGETYQQATKQ